MSRSLSDTILGRSEDEDLIERGNIDLSNRPRVRNADGSISTVRSIGVNVDGHEVLLPTVSDDGRILSDKEAVDQYKRTGKHLGKFRTVEASNRYAQQLHEQQAEMLQKDSKPTGLAQSILQEHPGATALRQGLRLTADQQPERAARVMRMQGATGLPSSVIDRHLEETEQQVQTKGFDAEKFRTSSPIVSKWLLEDPAHMAVAKDDLHQLGYIETLMQYGGNLARSLAAAVPSTGAGARRVLQGFAENILARTSVSKEAAPLVAKGMEEEAQAGEQLAESIRPKASGRLEHAAYSGLESLGQMALLAPLSLLGGEVAFLSALGFVAGGTAYGTARGQGLPPWRSALFAGGDAAIQVAAAKLPVRGLLSEFQLHTGLSRLLTRELAVAIPSMEAQTALSDLNAWASLPSNKDKTFGDYLKERPSAAADTLVSTLVSIVPMVGITRGIDRSISGKPTEQLFWEKVGEGTKGSKVGQRLPPELQNLVGQMTKDGPLETVYVDPEQWQTYWQSKKVDPRSVASELLGRDGLKQYDQAVETGHAIPIPTDAYAAKIAPTEHNAFFSRELRFDPEMQNAREADAYKDEVLDEDFEEEPRERSIDESAAKIREDIVGQMSGQGYSPEAVEAHARFMETAFKAFVGQRAGLDPYEVYKQYGLLISRALPDILTSVPKLDPTIDVLLDRIRSGRTPEPGEIFGVSLVDFLRQKGGVQDEGGELKALEVDADRRRGEKRLIRGKGLPLDRAREMAAEAGYLGKESSVADFLDKIESEVRGQPVYAKGAENQPVMETTVLMNQMQEYLQAVGIDVQKASNAEIKKRLTEAAEGPEYAQSFGAGKRGGITFDKDKNGAIRQTRITLTTAADASTAIHEFGHFWLEAIGNIAGDLSKMSPETLSDSQKRIVEDYGKILSYLGVESRADIKTPQHETWARSLEAYLAEGKAPSEELRSIFARVRQWMINAYRLWKSGAATKQAIGAALDVQLNDEVRGVFDRLLATDDEIRHAEEQAGVTGMLEDQQIRSKLGMTEGAFKPYQKLVQATRDAARDKLDAQLVREAARQHEAWWQEKRTEVRNQVVAEVNSQKDYRALSLLQSGKLPDGSEPPEGPFRGKLDAKALEDRYGKASTKPGKGATITNRLLQLDVYRRKSGVSPDVAAEFFGFRSGEELVDALVNTRPIDELIEATTDERMRTEYGDLQLSGEISEKARQAVMGPERSNVLMTELRAIRQKQREVEPFVKAAQKLDAKRETEGRRQMLAALPDVETVRAWAESRVGETPIRDLKPGMYWSAARKASKLSFEHASRDNWTNAYDQKLAELRNVEMYRAARARLDEIGDNIDEWNSRLFAADSKLSKTHDMDYVNAARSIASTILGYPHNQADAARYLKLVEAHDPELYAALSDQIEGVLGLGKTYKQMSINEFNGAADVVNGLFDQARRTRQLKIDGRLVDKMTAIQDLHFAISRLAKPGAEKRGYEQAVTKWENTKMDLQGASAALKKVEFWIDAMDRGDSQGVFRRYLWNPISDALGEYRRAKLPVLERFLEIVTPIEKTLASGKIDAPELNYTFENLGAVLHAIAHTGNESNLQKLLRGRNWGDYREDGTLDTSRWDMFIDRLQLPDRLTGEAVLRKEHYDAVQQIWDLFESLKPGAQRAHKEMYGAYFREVDPTGFEAFGQHYSGGYLPAIVDSNIDVGAASRAEKQSILEGDNATMWPTTSRGFTKSRMEAYAGPLQLDLRLLPQHLDKVVRFSTLQGAVKDVSRVLLDGGFGRILGTLDPTILQDALIPWLQRTAQQRTSTPTKGRGGKFIDRALSSVRTSTALNALTLNVADTLGRATTIFPSMLKVRPDYLLGGLLQYIKAPGEMSESIAEKSAFMETRTGNAAAQMTGDINDILLNPTTFQSVQNFTRAHSHFLQSGIHSVLDHSVWAGAFDQASARGLDEPQAIREADSIVRMTQGSYEPESISRLEGSSQLVKALTLYFGYFSSQRQLIGNELSFARDMGLVKGAARASMVIALGVSLPAISRELIYQAVGASPVKADESWLDWTLDTILGSQARFLAATVPGGSIASGLVDWYTGKERDFNISVSPIIPFLQSAGRAPGSAYEAIVKGTGYRKAVRDVLSLIGLLTKLPAGALARPAGYAADVVEGKADPESTTDVVRGVLSGRTPER